MIGRSLPFWQFLFPEVKKLFPGPLADININSFYQAINKVKPSLIRIESDEVTYNLHIIIRYEIEQALFNKEIKTSDLPAFWNEKMKNYLGIAPDFDRDGVLQDVHWSHGAFGYFPTYLLGNLYSAQWFYTIKKQIPDTDQLISRGNLKPILDWHIKNIHQFGRRYLAGELVEKATGEPLNPEYFNLYLKERFGQIYSVRW